MTLFNKVPMKAENGDYEIRVFYDDSAINIVAFRNNYPANGFRHRILIPKNRDVKEVLEKEPVRELIEISKRDITEKRWERLETG